MGKIDENIITKGFRGKYNEDLVFRKVDKQTIFSRRSVSSKPPTESQLAARARFNSASMYASSAIAHPQRSLDYKVMADLQGLKSAYLAAVTDYLTMPEIGNAFAGEYNGNAGDLITIIGKVKFKIVDLTVTILSATGAVIETGKAVPFELKWRYTATTPNPQVRGSRLVLVARDRQGKESTVDQVL
ncbi:hypothetical protein [Chryseolinea sp. H1M3-3]|uniref:hypothetical protein n=1 Tax=Chryseolinea sp. H1M3-3 TaxID=3034144 RepID=UPI0023EAE0C8|nr:hypothetical protein [Chryseolinea sp. H1M3-3]